MAASTLIVTSADPPTRELTMPIHQNTTGNQFRIVQTRGGIICGDNAIEHHLPVTPRKGITMTTTIADLTRPAKAKDSRSRKIKIGVLAGLTAIALPIGITTSSQAATAVVTVQTPATSSFDLRFGASELQGTIVWYYRTAHITGTIHAVTGSRQGVLVGTGADPSAGSCGQTGFTDKMPAGSAKAFNMDLTCNINGGFDSFKVKITDGTNQLDSLSIGQP